MLAASPPRLATLAGYFAFSVNSRSAQLPSKARHPANVWLRVGDDSKRPWSRGRDCIRFGICCTRLAVVYWPKGGHGVISRTVREQAQISEGQLQGDDSASRVL